LLTALGAEIGANRKVAAAGDPRESPGRAAALVSKRAIWSISNATTTASNAPSPGIVPPNWRLRGASADHPAWVAVRLDPYFRAHFARRRAHKPAQSAIIATAHRLLEVLWHVLNNCLVTSIARREARSRSAGSQCSGLLLGRAESPADEGEGFTGELAPCAPFAAACRPRRRSTRVSVPAAAIVTSLGSPPTFISQSLSSIRLRIH
jgi:hypothetical protein